MDGLRIFGLRDCRFWMQIAGNQVSSGFGRKNSPRGQQPRLKGQAPQSGLCSLSSTVWGRLRWFSTGQKSVSDWMYRLCFMPCAIKKFSEAYLAWHASYIWFTIPHVKKSPKWSRHDVVFLILFSAKFSRNCYMVQTVEITGIALKVVNA